MTVIVPACVDPGDRHGVTVPHAGHWVPALPRRRGRSASRSPRHRRRRHRRILDPTSESSNLKPRTSVSQAVCTMADRQAGDARLEFFPSQSRVNAIAGDQRVACPLSIGSAFGLCPVSIRRPIPPSRVISGADSDLLPRAGAPGPGRLRPAGSGN